MRNRGGGRGPPPLVFSIVLWSWSVRVSNSWYYYNITLRNDGKAVAISLTLWATLRFKTPASTFDSTGLFSKIVIPRWLKNCIICDVRYYLLHIIPGQVCFTWSTYSCTVKSRGVLNQRSLISSFDFKKQLAALYSLIVERARESWRSLTL